MTGAQQGLVDDQAIWEKITQSKEFMKWSIMLSTEENSWSSRISDWEKATQSACLIIKFRCQGSRGHIVVMWKFTGQWLLPYKSGRMDNFRCTARQGLQNLKYRQGKVSAPRPSAYLLLWSIEIVYISEIIVPLSLVRTDLTSTVWH
jgi:hypothetical protein